MIKLILLTVCLILSCWSQVAFGVCQASTTFNTRFNATIRQSSFLSACRRYKFEAGTLNITNVVSRCINSQVDVYDMNNNKLADLCTLQSYKSNGAPIFVELNSGLGYNFMNIILSYTPATVPVVLECGRPAVSPTNTKIVGGTAAKAHSWPWQVYLSIMKNGKYYMCGGSLIDNKNVLTAAHCIEGVTQARNVEVYMGIHYASEANGQGVLASKIVKHESYNTNSLVNDIAIIQLSSTVTFNSNVSPVCLPTSDLTANAGIVTGWGATNVAGSASATELMQVKIPIYPTSSVCGTGSINIAQQFCAGNATVSQVKDSCFGDSGGPVVTRDSTTDPFVIHGVVSYGDSSECNGNGIYTRVYGYLDWISKNKKTD